MLNLKAGQFRQARRPGDTLTQAVKQPYGVYYQTGHVFKGVQQDDMNNIKIKSRNIRSFCVRS